MQASPCSRLASVPRVAEEHLLTAVPNTCRDSGLLSWVKLPWGSDLFLEKGPHLFLLGRGAFRGPAESSAARGFCRAARSGCFSDRRADGSGGGQATRRLRGSRSAPAPHVPGKPDGVRFRGKGNQPKKTLDTGLKDRSPESSRGPQVSSCSDATWNPVDMGKAGGLRVEDGAPRLAVQLSKLEPWRSLSGKRLLVLPQAPHPARHNPVLCPSPRNPRGSGSGSSLRSRATGTLGP